MVINVGNALPKRKPLRLKDYDYRTPGAYFITVCTKDKKLLFGPVGADSISAQIVKRAFMEVIKGYSCVACPIFTVMPNHFHALIVISRADMESAPTIPEIVQAFKRYSTIEYTKLVKDGVLPSFDRQIWQRSFYDHVIRDQKDYDEIYRYIEENPIKWELDKLYRVE